MKKQPGRKVSKRVSSKRRIAKKSSGKRASSGPASSAGRAPSASRRRGKVVRGRGTKVAAKRGGRKTTTKGRATRDFGDDVRPSVTGSRGRGEPGRNSKRGAESREGFRGQDRGDDHRERVELEMDRGPTLYQDDSGDRERDARRSSASRRSTDWESAGRTRGDDEVTGWVHGRPRGTSRLRGR